MAVPEPSGVFMYDCCLTDLFGVRVRDRVRFRVRVRVSVRVRVRDRVSPNTAIHIFFKSFLTSLQFNKSVGAC